MGWLCYRRLLQWSFCRRRTHVPGGAKVRLGDSATRRDANARAQRKSSLVVSRQRMIVAIKVIHSLIFLTNSGSVTLILWLGLSGRRSRWTKPALTAALSESVVFVANRGRCPLTGLAEDLGAESGRVSDIFLPRWLADRIPFIFGPPLAIGLMLLAWRSRHSRRRFALALVRSRCRS